MGTGIARTIRCSCILVVMRDTVDDFDEARRAEAVRYFQAARGRYPGMMDTYQRARLAEIEADNRSDEAVALERAARMRAVQEPATAAL